MSTIIDKDEEKRLLEDAFRSSAAELIALFGRRRVEKTYLVRNTFFD